MKFSLPNKGFMYPAIGMFLSLLIIILLTEQGSGLYFFSDNRTFLGDFYFKYGTQLGEEPMYAILTIGALFISYRMAIKIPFIGFSIMGLSYLLKGIFLHKRPVMYYSELGIMDQFNVVEGVHLITGLTSFPSGHTMSGFGLFYLIALQFNKNWKVGLLCFWVAATIGISRIYLFEHFCKDVLVGAIIGMLVAQLMDYIFSYKKDDPSFWMNKSLRQLTRKTTV